MAAEQAERPSLRRVEAFPVEVEGERMICLRDPTGYTENTILVSPAAMFVLALCDGQHSRLDIQAEFAKNFGSILPTERFEELLEQVDTNLLMAGKRFDEHRERTEREYGELDARPSAFAGKVFPEKEEALTQHLEGIFTGEGGTGLPDPTRRNGPLRGAISPHIDFARGGPTYSSIYKVVGEEADASLFVILGTSHSGTERVYAATRKHFETPLGTVQTDRETLHRLLELHDNGLLDDEFAHRSEHSIEFQVIFLRYLFRDREFSILPILCGSFHEYVQDGRSPSDDPAVADFIAALRETVNDSGKRVFLLAGADLSHMGLKFGDAEAPTPESCEKLKRDDARTLDFALDGDAEGFYRSIQEEGDRRNVCGLSSIYTLLEVLDSPRGKLLKYAQSPDPTLPSVVSYAGVAYY